MSDRLITGLTKNKQVRIYLADTTDVTDYMRHLHDYSPMTTVIMGRLVTATLMMGKMSKIEEEKITVQLRGSNKMTSAIAVADIHGHVKATTRDTKIETIYNEKGGLDVGAAVGSDGMLYVIRDIGRGEPFVGSVQLVSGEIAEDMTHYFAQSEQIATAVGLGVMLDSKLAKVTKSGGYIVQLLPEADKETVQILEKRLQQMKPFSTLLNEGKTLEDIGAQLTGDLGLEELERHELHYQCDCSKEKVERGIRKLGRQEIESMIEEDDGAEVVCHFCSSRYYFNKEDLEEILVQIDRLQ